MTLVLTLISSPVSQASQDRTIDAEEFIIGRHEDCDWTIDDPDQYVSRRHCLIKRSGEGYVAVDCSSGGLFINDATQPMGPGKEQQLTPGMQLRMGDFIFALDLRTPTTATPEQVLEQAATAGYPQDPFFLETSPQQRKQKKPDTLPDPFTTGNVEQESSPQDDAGFDGFFDDDFSDFEGQHEQNPVDWGDFPDPTLDAPQEEASPPGDTEPGPELTPPPRQPTPATSGVDANAVKAFFRGIGLDGETAGPDEMEALGRQYRLLITGLVELMRSRDMERAEGNLPQTVMARSNNNPFKASGADDALHALIHGRPGFMAAEDAINASFGDLIEHRIKTWRALHVSLRRMIDRFDPDLFRKEVEATGMLEQLIAGGRSARLWQLYEARYTQLARAAEDRFLGEVGTDFRDAYIEEGK